MNDFLLRVTLLLVTVNVLVLSNELLDLTSRMKQREITGRLKVSNQRIFSPKVDMPQIGVRFKSNDSEDVIRKITQFAVGTIDVRMIELPTEFDKIKPVMEGIKAARVKREDLFLYFKQDMEMFGVDDTREEVEHLLDRSGLQYIDLYMIHYLDTKGFYLETWKVMIDFMHLGKIKAIGLCNINIGHLNYLYLHTGVLPAVVELEIHPFFQQSKMADQLQQLGIVVNAYSPLAAGKRLHEPRLLRIAKRYDKTVPQTMIKWCLQKGYSCSSSSRKINRVAENVDVFDFELSEDDMMLIDALDEYFVTSFDPSNMYHLAHIDNIIRDKLDKRLPELDDTNINRRKYSTWFEANEAEEESISTDNDTGDNDTESVDIVEEAMEPMHFSTDINIEVTPESEKAKKEDENAEAMKHKAMRKSTVRETESDVFHVPLSELSQTCQRLTKERYEKAMKEAEEMHTSSNRSGKTKNSDGL